MKIKNKMISFEDLGALFENAEYDHTWIFKNGVLEEGEDEKTLIFFLRYLYKPDLCNSSIANNKTEQNDPGKDHLREQKRRSGDSSIGNRLF